MSNPDSTNTADSAKARVADVLKAGLERDLASTTDMIPATHGSHVVSAKFGAGAGADEDAGMDFGWDDEKFERFAARLSELQDTAEPLS